MKIMTRRVILAHYSDAYEMAIMSRDYIEYGLGWSWTPGRIVKHIRDQDNVVIKFLRNNQMLGFAVMHFDMDLAHLNLLAVKPEFRKQGIGRELMNWLHVSAVTAGIETILLEVRSSNRIARSFYNRLGYKGFQTISGYYGGKETAVRMRKTLIKQSIRNNMPNIIFPWEKWQGS